MRDIQSNLSQKNVLVFSFRKSPAITQIVMTTYYYIGRTLTQKIASN